MQITIDMYWLAESEIIEEKAGRASFRIHYRKGEDLKHYDFEAPRSVAGKFACHFNVHLVTILNSLFVLCFFDVLFLVYVLFLVSCYLL